MRDLNVVLYRVWNLHNEQRGDPSFSSVGNGFDAYWESGMEVRPVQWEMNTPQDNPTRSDYLHVKMLALIAIVATQIPIASRIFEHRQHPIANQTIPRRKEFELFTGQKLYGYEGNPIDGMKTNFVEVMVVSNGWVRIRYADQTLLTLEDWVIKNCFEPVRGK